MSAMGTPRALRDGENAAAFYMIANGSVFALLVWYRAPIFQVATTADAALLAATLAYYAATMAFYMNVRRSDPGFLGTLLDRARVRERERAHGAGRHADGDESESTRAGTRARTRAQARMKART